MNCADLDVAMRVCAEEKRRRRGCRPVETRRRCHGPAWRHPKGGAGKRRDGVARSGHSAAMARTRARSEEHTSELQSLMRISYAVFCLKKKKEQKRRP